MKKIINFDRKLDFPSMIGEITSISLDHELKFKDESNIVGKFLIKGSYKRTEASRLEEDFSFDIPTEIILTEKLDLDTAKIDIDDFYYEIENDDSINCYIKIQVEGMEIVELSDEEQDDIELENHETVYDEIKVENEQNNNEVRECDGDATYTEEYIEKNSEDDNNVGIDTPAIEPKKENNVSDKLSQVNDINIQPQTTEIPEVKEKEELIQEEIIKQNDGVSNLQEKEEENEIMKENNNTELEINEDVGSLFTALKDSEETFSTYSVYILREQETLETVLTKFKVTKEELESYNDLSNITIGSKIIIPLTNESD